MESVIHKADAFMKNGNEQACLALLSNLCVQVPGNSDAWLKYALALDHFSKEEEAIPVYRKSMEIGLDYESERTALICLASSYRNIGQLDLATETIVRTLKKYPDNIAAECFYSLILADAGRSRKAVQLLGRALLKSLEPAAFEGFKGALDFKFSALTE